MSNGTCVGSSLEQIAKNVLITRSVNVVFVNLIPFMRSIIALCPELPFAAFFAKLQHYAISARVRDEMLEHIECVFQSIQVPPNSPSNTMIERTEEI